MNDIKLKRVIELYKKQIINQEENEAIKEKKEKNIINHGLKKK